MPGGVSRERLHTTSAPPPIAPEDPEDLVDPQDGLYGEAAVEAGGPWSRVDWSKLQRWGVKRGLNFNYWPAHWPFPAAISEMIILSPMAAGNGQWAGQ